MEIEYGPDIDHDTATFWHGEHIEPVKPFKKWEYQFVKYVQKDVTSLGEQGWELVSVIEEHSGDLFDAYAYFKRELREK